MKQTVLLIGTPMERRKMRIQRPPMRKPPMLKRLQFANQPRYDGYRRELIKVVGNKVAARDKRIANNAINGKLNAVLRMSPGARVAQFNTNNMEAIRGMLLQEHLRKMRHDLEVRGKQPMHKILSPRMIAPIVRKTPPQMYFPKVKMMEREKSPVKRKVAKPVSPVSPVRLVLRRCERKSAKNPDPYTPAELRRIAMNMKIPKARVDAAKASRFKLCDVIKAYPRSPLRSPHLRSPNRPPNRSPIRLVNNNINVRRVTRKTKAVPNPYAHANLMRVATKLKLFEHGQKSRYTATELIRMIKGKLS